MSRRNNWRKKKKSDDDDDEVEVKVKGISAFDGSQDVLHVYRLINRYKDKLKSLKITAHEEENWSVEKAAETYTMEHWHPESLKPQKPRREADETDESYNNKIDKVTRAYREWRYKTDCDRADFLARALEKEERKLNTAVEFIMSGLKGVAHDEMSDVKDKAPSRNPLFHMFNFMENNWMGAPVQMASKLLTAYNEFKCVGDPSKAILQLTLKKRQFEISNKRRVPNLEFIERVLNFIPSDISLYFEEVQRLRRIKDRLVTLGYNFDTSLDMEKIEDDTASVATSITKIDPSLYMNLTLDDDPDYDEEANESSGSDTSGRRTPNTSTSPIRLRGPFTPFTEGSTIPIIVGGESPAVTSTTVLERRIMELERKLSSITTDGDNLDREMNKRWIKEHAPQLSLKRIIETFKGLYITWKDQKKEREDKRAQKLERGSKNKDEKNDKALVNKKSKKSETKSDKKGSESKRELTCFKCYSPGHKISECPHSVYCLKCESSDHSYEKCPHRRNNTKSNKVNHTEEETNSSRSSTSEESKRSAAGKVKSRLDASVKDDKGHMARDTVGTHGEVIFLSKRKKPEIDHGNIVTAISDGGSTAHVFNSMKHLVNIRPADNHYITGVNGSAAIEAYGDFIGAAVTVDNKFVEFPLERVLYTPDASENLISEGLLITSNVDCEWILHKEYENSYLTHKWKIDDSGNPIKVKIFIDEEGLPRIQLHAKSTISTSLVTKTYDLRERDPTKKQISWFPGDTVYVRGDYWGNNRSVKYEKGIIVEPMGILPESELYPRQAIYEVEFPDGLFDVHVEEMSKDIEGLEEIREIMNNRKRNQKSSKEAYSSDSSSDNELKVEGHETTILTEMDTVRNDSTGSFTKTTSVSTGQVDNGVSDIATELEEPEVANKTEEPEVSNSDADLNKSEHDIDTEDGNSDDAETEQLQTNIRPGPKRTFTYSEFHLLSGHLTGQSLYNHAKEHGVTLSGAMDFICRTCRSTKGKRKAVPRVSSTTGPKPKVMEEIQQDFAKLLSGYSGLKYLDVKVDVRSGKVFVDFLPKRMASEMKANWKQFHTRHVGGKFIIKRVHSDGERGLISKRMKRFFIRKNIFHQVDPRDSPKLRSLVETKIRILKNITKTQLKEAHFVGRLKRFWPFAARHSARIMNNWRTKGVSADMKFGLKPTMPWDLPIFGSAADVNKTHTEVEGEKTQFEDVTTRMYFLDFDDRGKDGNLKVAYFLDPTTMAPVRTQNFTIYNGEFNKEFLNAETNDDSDSEASSAISFDSSSSSEGADDKAYSPSVDSLDSEYNTEDDTESSGTDSDSSNSSGDDERCYFGVLCGGTKSRRMQERVMFVNCNNKHALPVEPVVPDPFNDYGDEVSDSEEYVKRVDVETHAERIFINREKYEESIDDNDYSYSDICEMYRKLIQRGKVFMSRAQSDSFSKLLKLMMVSERKLIPVYFNLFTLDKARGVTIPKHFKDLLKNAHKDEWMNACEVEYNCLIKNNTWEVVELPPGRKAVDSRWIFVLKFDKDGNIKRYKARFVAKGFSQVEGLDYTDTYAPVVGMMTLKIVLSIAAAKGWDLNQFDVETAFLNAEVEEEIYVKQPEGFHVGGPNMVLKLKKALYGLKQAPYNWNLLLTNCLKKLGLGQSNYDPCLLTCRDERGRTCVLTVYVDDLLLTGDWDEMKVLVKAELMSKFRVNDVTSTQQLLGMEVVKDTVTGDIRLSQRQYILGLLQEFYCNDLAEYATPADTNTYRALQDFILSKKEPVATEFPYRECIGSLLYLSIMTRPDIANIVRWLARFVNNYHSLHIKFIKRVLGYLKGTVDVSIVYRAGGSCNLLAYSDASYADDYFTGRSTLANLLMMNGGPVYWKSTLGKFVMDSATHSEYAAMSDAVNSVEQAMKIKGDILGSTVACVSDVRLMNKSKEAIHNIELACLSAESVELRVDNLAAVHIATHDLSSKRSRCINVRFMNVRDKVLENLVVPTWVSTADQFADILTKCLGRVVFEKFRRSILSR